MKLIDVDGNSFGAQKVNVKAKNGYVDQVTGQMRLEQDVVITSEQGQQLKTDSLNWDRNKDLVTTDDRVELTDPIQGMEAEGKGAEFQPNAKKARLNEDVTVKVNIEADKTMAKFVTITCDGPMEIDQAKQKAVFHDNVVAIQNDRTLRADTMTVIFDPATSQIKEMICDGHVSIIQGENKTFADQAIYIAKDQTLILKGKPKLILVTEGENSIATFRN